MYLELSIPGHVMSQVQGSLVVSHTSVNKSAGTAVTIRPTLGSAAAVDTPVAVELLGGHSDVEDWGVGKHYTLTCSDPAAIIVNTEYNHTLVSCVIPAGQTYVTVTMTVANNPTVELDRDILITARGFSPNATVTIVDDNRDHLIDVTDPGDAIPALASYPVLPANSGATNYTNMKAILDHMKNTLTGDKFVAYFPAGTYEFANSGYVLINLPTNTNVFSFIGAKDAYDYTVDGLSVLKYTTPYANWTRLLSNQNSGYKYTQTGDSQVNAFALINMVLDGDNKNCGVDYSTYGMEQCSPYFINSSAAGFFQYGTEGVTIKQSCTGGFNPYDWVVARFYHYTGADSFKGMITASGGEDSVVYMKDCRGYGDDIKDKSGIWIEPEHDNYWTYFEDIEIYGRHGNIYTGGSRGEWNRVNNNARVTNNALSFHHADFLTIRNSTWRVTPQELDGGFQSVRYIGRAKFLDCVFIADNPDNWNVDMVAFPFYSSAYLGSSVWMHEFERCVFKAACAPPSGKIITGIHTGESPFNWTSYPTYYHKMTDCVWESTINEALYLHQGSVKTQLINPTFECATGVAGATHTAHVIYLNNTINASSRAYWLEIINPTWDFTGGKWLYQYGQYSTNTYDLNWLMIDGDIPKAQNVISRDGTRDILRPCYCAPSTGLLRVSSITAGNPTRVVFTTAHGQTGTFPIMFDGFSAADNAYWFNMLSPHNNVPLYEATVINSTTVDISLRSTGATSYDNTKDYAAAMVYPSMRTIIGEAGDNPMTSKPAGMAGDRYKVPGTPDVFYRCATSGVAGSAGWATEDMQEILPTVVMLNNVIPMTGFTWDGTWRNIDKPSEIPYSATALIMRIRSSSGTQYQGGFRHPSVTTTDPYKYVSVNKPRYQIAGLDAAKQVAYCLNASGESLFTIEVLGYFTDIQIITGAWTSYTPSATNTWEAKTFSGLESTSQEFAIIGCGNANSPHKFFLTDDSNETELAQPDKGTLGYGFQCFFCPVTSKVGGIKSASTSSTFRCMGGLRNAKKITPSADLTISNANQWETLDVQSHVGANAIAVILDIRNDNTSTARTMNLRPTGSTENITSYCNLSGATAQCREQLIMSLADGGGGAKNFDIYVGNTTDVKVKVLGYIE